MYLFIYLFDYLVMCLVGYLSVCVCIYVPIYLFFDCPWCGQPTRLHLIRSHYECMACHRPVLDCCDGTVGVEVFLRGTDNDVK